MGNTALLIIIVLIVIAGMGAVLIMMLRLTNKMHVRDAG